MGRELPVTVTVTCLSTHAGVCSDRRTARTRGRNDDYLPRDTYGGREATANTWAELNGLIHGPARTGPLDSGGGEGRGGTGSGGDDQH